MVEPEAFAGKKASLCFDVFKAQPSAVSTTAIHTHQHSEPWAIVQPQYSIALEQQQSAMPHWLWRLMPTAYTHNAIKG